jgi:phosphatidylserine/phosphatidylglycerophosphate/cardiolipin synthase-like enzyme
VGDDLGAEMIEEIDRSQQTIDVAVQQLLLPNMARALATKARSGVKVRVILENNYSRPWSELTSTEVASLSDHDRQRYREFVKLVDLNGDGNLDRSEIAERDALVILKQAGIPIIDDTEDGSRGSGLMHHKFMVIDGKRVVVSSANWTMSDIYGDISAPHTEGNQNHSLHIHSQELARAFTTEFNLMWGDGMGGNRDSQFGTHKTARAPETILVEGTQVTVQFSPTPKQQDWVSSTNGTIGQLLSQSQESVDFALFVFSEPQLGDILLERATRGIKVRGTLDRQFADRDYSQRLKLLGTCEPTLNQKSARIGVANLPTGDLLHHKFAIVDRHTIITGSHNWSKAANDRNDETLLILRNNSTVAAHFQREFDRLYQTSIVGRARNQRCEKVAEQ